MSAETKETVVTVSTSTYIHCDGESAAHRNSQNEDLTQAARDAFASGDVAKSRAAHMAMRTLGVPMGAAERHGSGGGGYLKSIVYGGLDGIITTFATVTSVAGANLSPSIVLILGIAHLFADGISMGMGDALSEQAEKEFNLAERSRESWEMENNMQGEIEEMVVLFQRKGVNEADARVVFNTLAKYKPVFLDTMMVEELGMMKPEASAPIKSGLVTFVSFVLFGLVPLLVYLINLSAHMADSTAFWIACGLTVFTLFVLGAVKGRLVDAAGVWWKSAVTMTVNGAVAAAIGYLLGFYLERAVTAAS